MKEIVNVEFYKRELGHPTFHVQKQVNDKSFNKQGIDIDEINICEGFARET